MWEFSVGAVCALKILYGCLSFHATLKDVDYGLYTTKEKCEAAFIRIMQEKTPNIAVLDVVVYTAECKRVEGAT